MLRIASVPLHDTGQSDFTGSQRLPLNFQTNDLRGQILVNWVQGDRLRRQPLCCQLPQAYLNLFNPGLRGYYQSMAIRELLAQTRQFDL